MIVISSTATFDGFDFPNCPREKLPDKPPSKNQSQKLMTEWIQIKEETMVYNLLIIINLIIHHFEDLIQVYQDQIPKIVMMIFMVHHDHPNTQVAD